MIRCVKGFKDILPEENALRERIYNTARKFFEQNGFKQIVTPILERQELFLRSIGENTDIVQKEMYIFEDKNGDMLALRPEGTASIARAYLENSLYNLPGPHKFYYIGPMFRRERPQKGRLRQFYQIGVELFNTISPLSDAHIIYILYSFFKKININDVQIEINSVGCSDCRPEYEKKLIEFLKDYKEDLCNDCKNRLERNPLRVLDCKNEKCKKIVLDSPKIVEYLCNDCREHYDKVKEFLNKFEVSYKENYLMVRGLDYYTKTVFEATTNLLGAQNAVGAGGRYDSLVKEIGGKNIPGIGFALGVERLVLLLDSELRNIKISPEIYIIGIGESTLEYQMKIFKELIQNGYSVEFDYERKGLKNQLKKADKLNVKYAVIIGDDEIKEKKVIVRNMANSLQEKISMEEIAIYFKRLMEESNETN